MPGAAEPGYSNGFFSLKVLQFPAKCGKSELTGQFGVMQIRYSYMMQRRYLSELVWGKYDEPSSLHGRECPEVH